MLRLIIDAKYAEDEMQKHLWLDIMPMDGLPENNTEVAKNLQAGRELQKNYRPVQCEAW